MFKTLNEEARYLFPQISDEKTFLAFRNLKECYLADANELNAYLVAAFRSVVIEKSLFENITKRGNHGGYY